MPGHPVPLRLPSGIDLHYFARGRGEPLIFLHGGMGDCYSWAPQMEYFGNSYHAIAYSRRFNYPNSNLVGATSHGAQAEASDLAALLQVLRLGPSHLVGTSYGALTALTLAVEKPELVRSMVLAEPPLHHAIRDSFDGQMLCEQFMTSVWAPAAKAFSDSEPRTAMRILYDGIWGRRTFDALGQDTASEIMRNAPSMRALTMSSKPFPELPLADIRSLRTPALLVRGENAIRIHRRVNEELARCLPNAEEIVIAGAGHGSARENAAAFNEAVEAFLQRQRFVDNVATAKTGARPGSG